MARELWAADGYELVEGLVRDVEYRDGLYRSPSVRGGNAVVAARHGEVWRPKKFESGTFVLNLWLGDASRTLVEDAYEDLLRVVTKRRELVRFVRTLADASTRECYGEVIESVEPRAIGSLGMRMGIAVRVPSGFWQDTADVAQSTVAGTALPQRLELTTFAAATAPMDELRIKVDGAVTNPRVTQEDTTDYVTWTGAVANAQSVTFDSASWGVSGTGAAPTLAATQWTGGRMLEVPPTSDVLTERGAPTVQLSGTGGGAGTKLTVTGRRKYLI